MHIDPADAAPLGTMSYYKLRQVFNLLNHEAVGIVVHTVNRSRSPGRRAANEIRQFDPPTPLVRGAFRGKRSSTAAVLSPASATVSVSTSVILKMNQPTGEGSACQISAAYSLIVRSLENRLEQATLTIALRAQPSGSA